MTKDNHDPGKFDLNSGGAGEQVVQVAVKPPCSPRPVSYPSINKDNTATAMAAAGGPLTGTALSLLLDAFSMMVANPCLSRAPSPPHSDAKLNGSTTMMSRARGTDRCGLVAQVAAVPSSSSLALSGPLDLKKE